MVRRVSRVSASASGGDCDGCGAGAGAGVGPQTSPCVAGEVAGKTDPCEEASKCENDADGTGRDGVFKVQKSAGHLRAIDRYELRRSNWIIIDQREWSRVNGPTVLLGRQRSLRRPKKIGVGKRRGEGNGQAKATRWRPSKCVRCEVDF